MSREVGLVCLFQGGDRQVVGNHWRARGDSREDINGPFESKGAKQKVAWSCAWRNLYPKPSKRCREPRCSPYDLSLTRIELTVTILLGVRSSHGRDKMLGSV